MKKRLLSILLTLTMVLSLVPVMGITASAADHNHNDWTAISNEQGLLTLFQNGGSGFLTDDIKVESQLEGDAIYLTDENVDEKTVNLCLNGHTLDLNKKNIILTDSDDVSFSLYDCSSEGTGKIRNGTSTEGGAVYVGFGTTFIMNGGAITDCTANLGGAVYCNGSFHMYGGSITKNKAEGAYGCCGGGVFNTTSTTSFHMHGGFVTNNQAAAYGGGVFNDGYDDFGDLTFDGKCVVKGNVSFHGEVMTAPANAVRDNVFILAPIKKYGATAVSEGSEIWVTLGKLIDIDNGHYYVTPRISGCIVEDEDISAGEAACFHSDVDSFFVVPEIDEEETNEIYLESRIYPQPDASNGYTVGIIDNDLTANQSYTNPFDASELGYLWYVLDETEVELEDFIDDEDDLVDYGTIQTDPYSVQSLNYQSLNYDEDYGNAINIYIPKDTIRVTFTCTDETLQADTEWGDSLERDGTSYTFVPAVPTEEWGDEDTTLFVYSENETNFTITDVKIIVPKEKATTDTDNQLDCGEDGKTYFCRVTYKDGSTDDSEKVTIDSTSPQAGSYTVTFHANNGTGDMDPQSFSYDVAQNLTANTFARSGFNFTGWAKSPEAKYAEYQDGASVKNLTEVASGNIDLYAIWTAEPIYSISGRVQQEKDPSPENVPNALVELKQGRNVIASMHTDSNGDYAFTGIESGEYNIVVTGHASGTRDKTKTTLILLEGENKTGVNVLLPLGDISSVVEVKNNTPQVLAGGLDEEAVKQAGSNLTDTIRLILTVKSVEDVTSIPGAPAADAQTAIKQEASGKTVDFIDMDVTEFINVLPGSAIHETDTVLEIIVPYQTAGKTDISVYRFHDADGDGTLDAGQQISMTKLNTRPTASFTDSTYFVGDGYLAVYSKYYSTYAIGYHTTFSSGKSGGTATKNITGEDTVNGMLTVSTKTSVPGKEITITVKPDEGYQLEKLTLTDANSNSIATVIVNETTFTFKMPASDVSVSAVFTKSNKCPQDSTCVYAKFSDANPKEWYHPGVHFCVEKGYMVGVSDTKFAPSGTLSRAMIVTMLWRIEGSPMANYAMSFTDVETDLWYTEAIRWAQSTGVVKGYDEYSFGPNDNVTREQLAAILMRYAAFKGIDVSKRADLAKFADVEYVSEWALENVKWANAVGIIIGRTETTIVPTGDTTRAEAANMVQRFCETVLK